MRMDKDQEDVSDRKGFGHSWGTYIHSMCGGIHIQAHMVARTRSSQPQKSSKSSKGWQPQVAVGRTRTERGFINFIVYMVNSVELRPLFFYSTDIHTLLDDSLSQIVPRHPFVLLSTP